MFQPKDDSYAILTLAKFRLHSAVEVLDGFGISLFFFFLKILFIYLRERE